MSEELKVISAEEVAAVAKEREEASRILEALAVSDTLHRRVGKSPYDFEARTEGIAPTHIKWRDVDQMLETGVWRLPSGAFIFGHGGYIRYVSPLQEQITIPAVWEEEDLLPRLNAFYPIEESEEIAPMPERFLVELPEPRVAEPIIQIVTPQKNEV